MFINTFYLHWEDWLMALPHPSLPPIAPPSLTPPLHTAYIKKAKQVTHTLLSSNDDTLCEGVRPPPSITSNFFTHDNELSFVTAQTEESANSNA